MSATYLHNVTGLSVQIRKVPASDTGESYTVGILTIDSEKCRHEVKMFIDSEEVAQKLGVIEDE